MMVAMIRADLPEQDTRKREEMRYIFKTFNASRPRLLVSCDRLLDLRGRTLFCARDLWVFKFLIFYLYTKAVTKHTMSVPDEDSMAKASVNNYFIVETDIILLHYSVVASTLLFSDTNE